MTQLTLVNTQQPNNQPCFDVRRLARFLLMRLNPVNEGDILLMLGKPYNYSDMDTVIHWLIDNQHLFQQPIDNDECYERLVNDLQAKLKE